LHVGGSATIAGTLKLAVTNGYIPAAGDRFAVVTYGSETGTFASVKGMYAGRTQLLEAVVGASSVVVNSIVNAADLVMGSVAVPASGTAGQDVTISYTVTNNAATATSASSWVDSVYLTQGTTLDIYGELIGRVAHTGALGASSSYTASLTAPLPGIIPGSYHVIAIADSEGFVPDVNRANNSAVASATIAVGMTTLTPGVTLSGTIASGQDEYFGVDLPAGQVPQITASFTNPAGGALYERFQDVPAPGTYDQLSFVPAQSTQQMILSGTHAGTYYLLVLGREGSGSGQSFSITVAELGLQVLGITPNQGTNAGINTVTL
jgi:hypothetical protein